MAVIQTAFTNFFNNLLGILNSLSFVDIIDVAVTAYIVYHGIRLVRETRAMQLVKGIAVILILFFVATQLKMITLSFFIQYILQIGIFVLVVLFQPELRQALERMGRSKFGIMRFGGGQAIGEAGIRETEDLIQIVSDCCEQLSADRTGALIVIERETKLGDVIKTGTLVDAHPSLELIGNIFFTNSPLHDGAMIIRDHRIHAAGCYLPLSQNMEIGRELGTRHRAALGVSEVSDAVVVVVSEETGAISVATESHLQRKLSIQNLKKLLRLKLLGNKTKEKSPYKIGFWRKKNEK